MLRLSQTLANPLKPVSLKHTKSPGYPQNDGAPAVAAGAEALAGAAAHEQALRQKAAVVEAAHTALDDARLQLRLDRAELDRARAVAAATAPAPAPVSPAPPPGDARALREAQSRAQRLEVALENKTLLAIEAQEGAARHQTEAARLQKEVARVSKVRPARSLLPASPLT
jgi:hypothetical protein